MDTFKRIAGNAASLLTSNVISRAMSFLTYALVARYLGAFQFGQLSLGVALFSTFQVIAVAGLSTVVTREISKNRADTSRYFINSTLLVLASSILSTAIMLIVARILNYQPETSYVIFVLSLGLVPYALSQITEAIFKAWEEMQHIAYANVPANVAQVAIVFLLLSRGFDVRYVAGTMVGVYVLILLIGWVLLLRMVGLPRARIEPRFAFQTAKTASTFFGIQSLNAVRSNIAILVLSKFVTETEVGFYNAAAQLTIPLRLIFDNFVASVFPVMVRRFEEGKEAIGRIARNILELLMAIALPGVIGILTLGAAIIDLFYGLEEFAPAVSVLNLIIWIPLLKAFTTVTGQIMWASGREKVTLRIAVATLTTKFVLSLIFVSQFGLMGAAVAVLLEQFFDAVLHYLPVSDLMPGASLAELMWRPALAAAVMAVALIPMRTSALYVSIPLGAAAYTVMMLAVSAWAAGGFLQLKRKYVQLWSE